MRSNETEKNSQKYSNNQYYQQGVAELRAYALSKYYQQNLGWQNYLWKWCNQQVLLSTKRVTELRLEVKFAYTTSTEFLRDARLDRSVLPVQLAELHDSKWWKNFEGGKTTWPDSLKLKIYTASMEVLREPTREGTSSVSSCTSETGFAFFLSRTKATSISRMRPAISIIPK